MFELRQQHGLQLIHIFIVMKKEAADEAAFLLFKRACILYYTWIN
jgi:hypothetical protein